MQFPWVREHQSALITATLGVLLAGVGWSSLNYVSADLPGVDSGVFTSGAMHLLAGKTLYKDVWDTKPPMVFLINAAALRFGDGTINVVRRLERGFDALAVALIFLVALRAFKEHWLAVLGALLFARRIFAPALFEGGNLTEEYGIVFALGGIGACLAGRQAEGRASMAWSAVGGFLFSLGVLTKEPFLLSSAPWFIYLVVDREKPLAFAAKRGGAFILGALAPVIVFLIYLIAHGALSNWLDVLEFNRRYSQAASTSAGSWGARWIANLPVGYHLLVAPSAAGTVLAALGVASLFSLDFLRKTRFVPVAVLGAVLAEYTATMLAVYNSGHYYIQLAVSYTLLVACGLAFLNWLLSRYGRAGAWACGVVLAALVAVDGRAWLAYAERCMTPPGRAPVSPMAEYVRQHSRADEPLWATTGDNARLYLEAQRLSPTKYFGVFTYHFFPTRLGTRIEKINTLRSDLVRCPPKFIVVSDPEFLRDVGVSRWVARHYRPVPISDGSDRVLYERVD